jgi:general secretion pathway protein G
MNHRIARDLSKRRHGQAGMTLIEIMVVLTLIGLLTAVLAANFFGMAENQKAKIAETQMETIKARVDAFKLEYGRYPSTSEGLNSLVTPPPKKSGRSPAPFLDNADLLTDPWGNQLAYFQPGRSGGKFEIVSLGADGASGGDGADSDITVSK